MRILGLDLGERQIGVAISDEKGWTAQPLHTWKSRGAEENFAEIEKLVSLYGVEEIVVGVPYRMSGEAGPEAEKATHFIKKLRERVRIPIVPWDERLTTKEAERVLLQADLSRKKRREKIDQIAAALILQNYLNSKVSPHEDNQ